MKRLLVLAVFLLSLTHIAAAEISPAGQKLASILDGMNVEHLWLARETVNWETGEPDGRGVALPKGHTHCSAFVAATAEKIGVYILRPPAHSARLLANAQEKWLHEPEARKQGWRRIGRISDPGTSQAAVDAANRGELVVAVYHASRHGHPGHIAIVRPSDKSAALIASEGPDIIQAGLNNYRVTSLKDGFAEHPPAWREGRIEYYAHATNL